MPSRYCSTGRWLFRADHVSGSHWLSSFSLRFLALPSTSSLTYFSKPMEEAMGALVMEKGISMGSPLRSTI